MKKFIALFIAVTLLKSMDAQVNAGGEDTTWKKNYRGTATRINDLVHTKLDVRFDYAKAYMYGKAWITLQPHFYPTDSLALDAKGMDIHTISLVNGKATTPLKYDYDGMVLNI